MTVMTPLVIFIANYLYLLPVALFVAYAFKAKERKAFVMLSIFALPISYLVGVLAGHLFYDPRPFVVSHSVPLFPHAPDNGFPSDHALLTGTLAAIVTVFNAPLGALLWLLALLIGAARVFAGVHHALDIAGSFAIAIASAALVRTLLARFRKPQTPAA